MFELSGPRIYGSWTDSTVFLASSSGTRRKRTRRTPEEYTLMHCLKPNNVPEFKFKVKNRLTDSDRWTGSLRPWSVVRGWSSGRNKITMGRRTWDHLVHHTYETAPNPFKRRDSYNNLHLKNSDFPGFYAIFGYFINLLDPLLHMYFTM